MITGPLGMRFGERALPRVETGEIAGYDLPTPSRVRRWFDLAPMIGDDLFLKLYTHGAAERNLEPLLGGALGNLFRWIAEEANRRGIEVHWATAWQMYQAVEALIEPAGAAKKGGSVMLLQYFGFQQDPFGATPDPRCLYLSGTHREALASLEYGFLSNRGFTAMIAPPGMGKTTLLCRFLEEHPRQTARTVFLFDVDAECEPKELVAYILRDIGITPAQSSSEMHEQLTGALVKENRAGRNSWS
jgi:type II secretory pathway predicted ATPase ExeA